MYADDLCALVSGINIAERVRRVLHHMKTFGIFFGLLLNLCKSGVVVQGKLCPQDRRLIETTPQGDLFLGLHVHTHLKYLRVRVGNISSDEAFAGPLGEAQRRAAVVASWSLSASAWFCLQRGSCPWSY